MYCRLNNPAAHSAQPCLPIRAELIGAHQCSALGIAAQGTAPVLNLCTLLLASGADPATALHAYRGGMLCLTVRSIGQAARLEISSHGTGFIPIHRRRTASPVAPTAKRHIQPHKQAAARRARSA